MTVIALFFVSLGLMAQQRKGAFGLSGTVGQMLEISPDDTHETTFVLGLSYMFADRWTVELDSAMMDVDHGDFGYYSLNLLYNFHPERRAVPYLAIGAGDATMEPDGGEEESEMLYSLGGGFHYALSRMVNLKGDVRYIQSDLEALESGIQFQVGVGLQFGGEDRPQERPVEHVDRDMDGVPDSIDYCWDTPPQVEVDSRGCPIDTDGDGTPDYLEDKDQDGVRNYDDECPETQKTYPVDTVGCPLDSDEDGLLDGREKELGTDPNKADTDGDGLSDGDEVLKYHTDPLKVDTDGDELSDGDEVLKYKTDPLKADTDEDGFTDGVEILRYQSDPTADGDLYDWVINGNKIHFDFDEYELKEDAITVLDDISLVLLMEANVRIRIKGHCDWIGPKWYNNKLSLKRAESAKEYLVKQGISPDQIETVGLGEDHPIADNETEEGRAKNRRDEFEVISK